MITSTEIAVENLAHKFATKGGTLEQCRADYDGACIDFAGDFESAFGGRLVYFETPNNPEWRYHCAVAMDGIIHDLWHTEPMPIDQFAQAIGATSWEYTT